MAQKQIKVTLVALRDRHQTIQPRHHSRSGPTPYQQQPRSGRHARGARDDPQGGLSRLRLGSLRNHDVGYSTQYAEARRGRQARQAPASAVASARAWARPPAVATRARSRVRAASTRLASKAARCRCSVACLSAVSRRWASTCTPVRLSELQLLEAEEIDVQALKAAGVVGQSVRYAKVIKSGELSRRWCFAALPRRPALAPPSKPRAARLLEREVTSG